MDSDRNAEILSLIERLTCEIEVARKHSLQHTEQLLRIAILDLQTILASITDDDLRELTETLYEELQVTTARQCS